MASLKGLFPGPFAGPGTQKAYEAALGQFLVAFNGIDNRVREITRYALSDLGRPELWNFLKNQQYQQQVTNLQLISLGVDWLSDLPYQQMMELNKTRNLLAHGHYDQDLFSESFRILDQRKMTGDTTTVEDVRAATAKALNIQEELASLWAHLHYEPPE